MAFQLKMLIELNVHGDRLFVTDKTGVYDATNNPGGWGAPNPELAMSAIALLVQRVAEDPSQFVFVSPSVTHNPTAVNSDEALFELIFGLDGHIRVTEFRLPVSLDALVTLEGDAILAGSYFLYNGAVHKLDEASLPVEVTDYSEMLGNIDIPQATCDDLLYPILKKQAQQLWLKYKAARACDDAGDEEFDEFRKLYHDLIGTDWDFNAGLVTQAEENIDTLLEKYELV